MNDTEIGGATQAIYEGATDDNPSHSAVVALLYPVQFLSVRCSGTLIADQVVLHGKKFQASTKVYGGLNFVYCDRGAGTTDGFALEDLGYLSVTEAVTD